MEIPNRKSYFTYKTLSCKVYMQSQSSKTLRMDMDSFEIMLQIVHMLSLRKKYVPENSVKRGFSIYLVEQTNTRI